MKIAVVSANRACAGDLAKEIGECGHEPQLVAGLAEAAVGESRIALAVWDDGPGMAAILDGLKVAAGRQPPLPVVVFVPPGALAARTRALAAGAIDVLSWPPEAKEINAEIKEILQNAPLLDGIDRDVYERLVQTDIIGQSPQIKQCIREMLMAARCDANVLFLGETGTGKEVLARGVHLLSRRVGNPYLVVHCPALQGNLLESELFGHVKGAFTGAESDRRGRFEEVGAGTLLLDEIGFVSLDFQAKLLRVLEQRIFQRVGDGRDITCHARLMCATSVDLEEATKNGVFRPDLLGRINQLRITLPPLRERRADIPVLVRHFLGKHARGRPIAISRIAAEILESAEWPRNIRQLENVLVGALVRCEAGDVILPRHLPKEIVDSGTTAPPPGDVTIRIPAGKTYKEARELACREIDALYLPAMFRRHERNVSNAVKEAGIDRKTFNDRLKEVDPSEGSEHDG